MTIQKFIGLPHQNQPDAIGDQGVFQYKLQEAGREVTTFRIDDFFVDVYFSLQELRITGLTIRCAPVDGPTWAENPKKGHYSLRSAFLRFPPEAARCKRKR